MSELKWDESGKRFYETGVKKGVLYPKTGENGAYAKGVAWNGLTAINESPSGAEPSPLYADDIKYLNLLSNEDFGLTIEAYTYPDEFAECDGSKMLASGLKLMQQPRKQFGLSYVTTVGNDEEGNDLGYLLHIVYGCMAAPSEKSYASINDSPEAITFSWEVTTTPVEITTVDATGKKYKPTAHLVIDSRIANSTKLKALEDILYGTNASGSETTGTDPRLPDPDTVISTLAQG